MTCMISLRQVPSVHPSIWWYGEILVAVWRYVLSSIRVKCLGDESLKSKYQSSGTDVAVRLWAKQLSQISRQLYHRSKKFDSARALPSYRNPQYAALAGVWEKSHTDMRAQQSFKSGTAYFPVDKVSNLKPIFDMTNLENYSLEATLPPPTSEGLTPFRVSERLWIQWFTTKTCHWEGTGTCESHWPRQESAHQFVHQSLHLTRRVPQTVGIGCTGKFNPRHLWFFHRLMRDDNQWEFDVPYLGHNGTWTKGQTYSQS